MAASAPAILAFNRGRISPLALARIDFKRTAMSAEVQTNWMPRALGSMGLRAGLGYTGATRSNLTSVSLPFVFSTDDTARLELTNLKMQVWVNDVLVTRPAVTATIANGGFGIDLTGWSDEDTGTAVSSWLTGGFLSLIGDGNSAAKRRQQVTCGNVGVRHALNIVIERGPVLLRVGSAAGLDDYIAEATLLTGYHSLAFTPAGDFWIDLFSFTEAASLVDSVAVAPAGAMEVTTPWLEADMGLVRWDQSGDVLFCACSGYRQRRIERRATDSWSVVLYQSDDGPFRVQNVGPVTITPSATSGDITLTASQALFKSTQIGTLFKLVQSGQSQDVSATGADQWSDPIRVTGVDGARVFSLFISGTWVATVTLQYSVASPGDWVDATSGSFTANDALSYDDTLDNQVIYYRIGVKAGGYTSGTVEARLEYSSGSQTGIARVTSFTSSTVVNAAVLSAFGGTSESADWSESYWSAYRGFPSAVALHEGGLWWAGKNRIWRSIIDAFSSFDDEFEGDAGPISRSIGSGPVDSIFWLISGSRLLIGAAGYVLMGRSSSLDEPITPTNFNMKAIDAPGDGAASVNAVRSGTSAVYVQQSGQRVYQADVGPNGYDYVATDLTDLVPEAGEPSVIKIVEQSQPERRRHCIRSDGTVALQVYGKQEEVTAWIDIETTGAAGFVEDAVVLPGAVEDQVYYTVRRTIDGATVRYHEKWALESQLRGFPEARLSDAYAVYSGAATTTLTGLDHLEGEEVTVWGWNTVMPFLNAEGDAIGRDLGVFTVTGGAISGLSDAVTNAVTGLAYTARYKSTKLSYAAEALTAKKRVSRLGIIARWIHALGLRYGPNFDELDDLPQVEGAQIIDPDDMRSSYDEEQFEFGGNWDTDSRLCLEAASPRPVTILGCILGVETNPKS